MGVLSRSPVICRHGVVAAGHPLASSAGLHALLRGGNAIDAAFTAAMVMGVVQPNMSGVGGDTFLLYRSARERKVWALNGSGIAPRAATAEWFAARGHRTMPLHGMLSVGVPGAVDAMTTALARWGTFPPAEVLRPAIGYAEEGAPVAPRVAAWIAEGGALLARYPASARLYLRPDGSPLRAGDLLRNPDLARTLRLIAEGGSEAFYRGEIARRIVAYMAEHGGLYTEREFAEHASDVTEPLATTYRGYTVLSTPPQSQGIILLEMLNLLEGFDLARSGWGSAETVHAMVEAKKLAFADRLAYLADPRWRANPTAALLSKAYAARRRASIDAERAIEEPPGGGLDEHTTYLCAVDDEGNAASLITSNSGSWGCGEVVEGTGVLLNNRVGRGFSLVPGHPNVLEPGKRTMHTLMANMALRGDTVIVFGTPGGDGQPQWNAQVLSGIVDFGMDPQEAVESPRWVSRPGTDPAGLPAPYVLGLEPGFPAGTAEALARRGHRVVAAPPAGGAQVIAVDGGGVRSAGSDPRVDGQAAGY